MNDADRVTAQAVLDTPMDHNPSGATTIREYLVLLARGVWVHGDEFSGKRPFGYSSWPFDVYTALIKAGFIEGTFDEDGYVDTLEPDQRALGDAMVLSALLHLSMPEQAR